jgi:hypothetical protein
MMSPFQIGFQSQRAAVQQGVWRVWNDKFKSWSVFGQDHLVKTLLGSEAGDGGCR